MLLFRFEVLNGLKEFSLILILKSENKFDISFFEKKWHILPESFFIVLFSVVFPLFLKSWIEKSSKRIIPFAFKRFFILFTTLILSSLHNHKNKPCYQECQCQKSKHSCKKEESVFPENNCGVIIENQRYCKEYKWRPEILHGFFCSLLNHSRWNIPCWLVWFSHWSFFSPLISHRVWSGKRFLSVSETFHKKALHELEL